MLSLAFFLLVNIRTPNDLASAARHRPDRQWSKLMLNFGSWAGRLRAVLGAAGGASALPASYSPNLQNINRCAHPLLIR
jgi:hypothetical protein